MIFIPTLLLVLSPLVNAVAINTKPPCNDPTYLSGIDVEQACKWQYGPEWRSRKQYSILGWYNCWDWRCWLDYDTASVNMQRYCEIEHDMTESQVRAECRGHSLWGWQCRKRV
ncbi:hypothetical protein QBC38DRAFT_240961 [Podospora fimiseda]|uniref:Secreted protein n=1 Tax=Podospora fimiseda TaxID=252190 RepID=A0AAN7BMD9_9PEZI|nr:hypothetical protein QBC38DRAFT_240961 [Podospora fimiseda]